MIIGLPKETKKNEFRVALAPKHVVQLTKLGHKVFVEKDAGKGCKFLDADHHARRAVKGFQSKNI